MSGGHDKHDTGDHLEQELRQILKRIEREPVSDELRTLAKQLEDALRKRDQDGNTG
ncbi:MAG: hypothetical protein JJU15_04455 [Pararhodobacter sp.]|nr:hypothetical protein [Pararhodobacter sp.]